MAAPTVIKWSDTGAPTLNNTAGSLIAVLDFCLPQRGWVKEFTGTNKAVYRAGTGNRKFYRVLDDNSSGYGSHYFASITGYDSMTDVDTGAGWGQISYAIKSYNDALSKRWVCIVDEKGFLLLTQPHGGVSVDIELRVFFPAYVGETVPSLPGQAPRDVIAACTTVSWTHALGMIAYDNAGYYVRCNRSLDGLQTAINIVFAKEILPTGRGSANPTGNFVNCIYNYPYNGALLYCKHYLGDTPGIATIGDYIPWVYHTPQKGYQFQNLGEYTADGKTLMAVLISFTAPSAVVVSTSTVMGVILIALNEER